MPTLRFTSKFSQLRVKLRCVFHQPCSISILYRPFLSSTFPKTYDFHSSIQSASIYCGLNCVPPPKFIYWNPNLQGDRFGDGTLKVVRFRGSHKGGTPSLWIEETVESWLSLSLWHVKTQWERDHLQVRNRAVTGNQPCCILILDLASESERGNSVVEATRFAVFIMTVRGTGALLLLFKN